jgi:hypothetical protein
MSASKRLWEELHERDLREEEAALDVAAYRELLYLKGFLRDADPVDENNEKTTKQ